MTNGKVALVVVMAAGCAGAGPTSSQYGPPPPQDMDPAAALGLWRSNFGAVKVEADNSRGGLQAGAVHGVWQYDRQGQEVVGYFFGALRGNVLSFRWQEPANPPLLGEGFVVFDQAGRQFSGRWWSDRKDRVGAWNGGRAPTPTSAPNPPNAPNPASAPDPDLELEPTDRPPPAQPPAVPPPGQPAPPAQLQPPQQRPQYY